MNFFSLVAKRHSVRHFADRSVSVEQQDKILAAAQSAPSAGNLKAYAVTVVTNQEKRKKLASCAADQSFIAEAPIVFIFCALPDVAGERYGKRGRELYTLQDATIACAYAQLAATELGLGSCWIGAMDEESIRLLLGLETTRLPIALLPVGYAG